MIRKFIQLIVFLWLSAATGLLCSAQEYALRGLVVNEQHHPMGGVQLSINGSAPVTTTPEGRFQVQPKSSPADSQHNVVIHVTGYRLKHQEVNARKELELTIEPIYKTLGGWVRTVNKLPLSGVLIKFRNATIEKTAVTDRDGFFRIQLPSETPVTLADFAVESYKVENSNIELRKVKDDNLKFVQEDTFVFLTVSGEEPLMEIATGNIASPEATRAVPKPAFTHTTTPNNPVSPEPFKISKDDKNLQTLIGLISAKRSPEAVTGTQSQIISKEIALISEELSRLQELVSNARSDQEKAAAEAAFAAYINDDYISQFIESLRKIDPNNPLVILLEKYKRANRDILDAKNESDRQLNITAKLFKVSTLIAVLFVILTFVAVFFAISNSRQKKKLQEATTKLEEERRRLEILNEELKMLMGIVAHDLKAPLNKVLGLTQLLPLVGLLNEEQSKYVSMVNQVAYDGRQFIENLLDLKAIEEQKRHLKTGPLEIMDWLRRSVVGYEQTANKKNIQINIQANVTETWISVDQSAFGQIVDNLVSNAIKFSSFDKNIVIQVEAGYSLVSIAIIDEGPGISEEDQQKMFKKFQCLSARPTAGEHSSGLGLSIVKMLIEQMGGEIHLKSLPGQGSAFTVYFHKYQPEENLVEAPGR